MERRHLKVLKSVNLQNDKSTVRNFFAGLPHGVVFASDLTLKLSPRIIFVVMDRSAVRMSLSGSTSLVTQHSQYRTISVWKVFAAIQTEWEYALRLQYEAESVEEYVVAKIRLWNALVRRTQMLSNVRKSQLKWNIPTHQDLCRALVEGLRESPRKNQIITLIGNDCSYISEIWSAVASTAE